jgi:hypothetical protein
MKWGKGEDSIKEGNDEFRFDIQEGRADTHMTDIIVFLLKTTPKMAACQYSTER